MSKNVLVTGGAGYVGSVVVAELAKAGYNIKCLDRFFFGTDYPLWKNYSNKIETIRDDIRWFDAKILDGIDIVLDLAALSNDPVGELDPSKTYEINFLGRSRVARLSKLHGVKRYVLASSGSSYGINKKETVNEDSPLSPLTTYAKANRMAEIDNLFLNDENFLVTVLRFSSIYGISPRMRFDIAVNNMAKDLYKTGKITVTGDGKQWRPFLHIKDAADAYRLVIEAKSEKISGQVFNVGSDDQNYDLLQVATEVGDAIGKKYEIVHKDTHDDRYYIVSFKKIKETLGFSPKFRIKDGAVEVYNALEKGEIEDSLKTITIEWYKHLQESTKDGNEVRLRGTIL